MGDCLIGCWRSSKERRAGRKCEGGIDTGLALIALSRALVVEKMQR